MYSFDVLLCGNPGNLIAVTQNESVFLKWDNVDTADGYRVYIYDSFKQQYNSIKYTTAPEKVIYSLTNNIEYRFKVKAYKLINGEEFYSDFSESVVCTPVARGFTAKESFFMLNKLQTYNMNCSYDGYPTNSVEYSSSNEEIVTVDYLGTITAVSSGEAIVTAFSPTYNQSAKIKIVVDRVASKPAIPIFEPRFICKDGLYVNPSSTKSLFASIAFTGDMMCISNQQKMALNDGTYNFINSFELIRPVIIDDDFAIGTLETMLSSSHPYALDKLKVDGKSNCNAPSNFLDGVRYAGFDAVVTATNHSCDTELNGIEETLSYIKQYNFMNLGIGERFFIVEINGIKVAFFAYTMVTNNRDDFLNEQQKESMLCRYSKKTFENDYKSAMKKGADFSIVMMHWGIMNSTMVRDSQISAAKEMADVGADYIIGSHPHVLQKADIIKSIEGKEVPVIYSLGNLISSMREMSESTNTMILRLNIEKKSEGVVCNSQYIPCVILHKYKDASYVTAPIISEFCGYEGTNTTNMIKRINDIHEIANNKIDVVAIEDNIFKKLARIAPEALLFKAFSSIKENTLLIEWEQIDGAEGYRIYSLNKSGIFTGLCNSFENHIEINIQEYQVTALKIKAFRSLNGNKKFIANSEILNLYASCSSGEQEPKFFKAWGYSIGTVVVLLWDNIDGAEGYRIDQKKSDNFFSGLWNRNTNFLRIMDIKTEMNHEFKINAYRMQNGQKKFFALSEIVNIHVPYCRALPALISETENGMKIDWILDKQAQGYRLYKENSDGIFTGVTDVSSGQVAVEVDGDVRFKIKPYITIKSQRIYYNSSHILTNQRKQELPLISFVVPEYNDEKYLERVFNSIISNTIINYEVIVVNDGSTDNSQKIIDKYCEKFPQVFKSIVKENGGVTEARNAGVVASRGRYIGFIDSDDRIRPETCELYEKAIQTDADIIISAYYKHEKNENKVIQGKLPFEEYCKHNIDLYLSLLYGKGYAGQAVTCNKLYRSELIKDKPIPLMNSEEVAWSPYIASYADSFAYIATPLYEYIRREDSISDIINKKTDWEIFERRMKSINFFLEKGNPLHKERLYDIAEKRLEWHIKNTKKNSLYVDELEKLKAKRSSL